MTRTVFWAFVHAMGVVFIALPLAMLHVTLAVVAHPLLRLFGCQGTIQVTPTTLSVGFNREAFKRRGAID